MIGLLGCIQIVYYFIVYYFKAKRSVFKTEFNGILLALPIYSMRSRVCVMTRRPYVRLPHRSTAATASGGFAAESHAGRRYRLLAASACAVQHADAQQQMRVASF